MNADNEDEIVVGDLVMEVEVDEDADEVFSITSDSNSIDSQSTYQASISSSHQNDEESTQTEQLSSQPASCSQKRSEPSPGDTIENESKKQKISDENEDDGKLCNICLDNWTNSGGHRICALKCGHLFGHSCILRWILSNKSCPTCKVKGGKGDIRFIYANKLIAMDTTELEIMRKQLDITIEEKNRVQIELTKSICKEHLLVQEIEEYKQKIKILNTLSDGLGTTNQVKVLENKGTAEKILRLKDSLQVCQQGSCRVMDIHPHSGKFVISLKSPNNIFQGYGVRKYNIENFTSLAYTPLHTKVIRDVKFHSTNNSLLTVSLDKVVKVVDINSNSQIGSYVGENMLWSCCWDATRPDIFYVGEQQGSITKFDVRRMSEPLDNFKIPGDMSPVVSLVSVPSYPGCCMPFGGFVACKLNSIWAFEATSSTEYSKYIVPIDGPFSSMSFNYESNLLLISARPNSRELNTRHIVTSLEKASESEMKSRTVHTFSGGRLQKQLSRSCFLKNAHNQNSYVAAQLDNSIALWSVNSGRLSFTLGTRNSVLDLMPLNNNSGSYLLALSEKKLEYYKFVDPL